MCKISCKYDFFRFLLMKCIESKIHSQYCIDCKMDCIIRSNDTPKLIYKAESPWWNVGRGKPSQRHITLISKQYNLGEFKMKCSVHNTPCPRICTAHKITPTFPSSSLIVFCMVPSLMQTLGPLLRDGDSHLQCMIEKLRCFTCDDKYAPKIIHSMALSCDL